MNKFGIIPVVIAIALLIVVLVFTTCTYILDEREQAVIVRFSRPIKIVVGEDDPERFAQIEQEILAVVQREDMAGSANIELGSTINVSQGAGVAV
jgi:regulator of protease activity HflC (stomatin/prohibitin superfamily)